MTAKPAKRWTPAKARATGYGKRSFLGNTMAGALTRSYSATKPRRVRRQYPVAVHPVGVRLEWFRWVPPEARWTNR